jgi:putative holliday junction resolvase
MPRVIAIDYGQKRTGLAVTDVDQIIAGPLDTVATQDLISFLTGYLAKEPVECFVVGKAYNMDFSDSQSAKMIEDFVVHLGRKFPMIKIERIDERFTSKMASQTILDSGKNRKARQDKALVDKVSAVILLQDYLLRKEYGRN